MAGWFLGVCHVDSGREHQPAPIALCGVLKLRPLVGCEGVGLCNCSVLCLCACIVAIRRRGVRVLFVERLFGKQ